jgi:hypothetical protein
MTRRGHFNGVARAGKLALAVAACLLVAAAAAPAALATVRYAAPSGAATVSDCTSPDPMDPTNPPCTLQRAVEVVAQDTDEVVVATGDYIETADQLNVLNDIDVHGVDGMPAPRIVATFPPGSGHVVRLNNPGATLRHLTLVHSGTDSGFLLQAGLAEQLVVDSVDTACEIPLTSTLRDSVCWTHGPTNEAAISVPLLSPLNASITLRNVTAIATGTTVQGIFADAEAGANVTVDGVNVIARGSVTDVSANTDGASTATVSLDHSNYATEKDADEGTGAGASVTDPGSGTNQTSAPLFANAAGGDFHQVAGSPTIDAGTAAASLLGTLDFDGDPRVADGDGICPTDADIGADELVAGPAPDCSSTAQPPAGDTTPPDTQIIKRPKDKTKKKTATFEFSSTEPGSTFECSLDGGPFTPCSSPDTLKVKKGKHGFMVRSRDAAGNVDPTPATDGWKVKKKKKK